MVERPLLILGAGTFAVEALEAAELSGRRVRGFVVSESRYRTAPTLEGLPIYVCPDALTDVAGDAAAEAAGSLGDLPFEPDDVFCIAGIISTKRRALVEVMERRGYAFTAVKHPSAIVSPRAAIAAGALIGAGVIVAANTRVGKHVILNRGANVAHDADIGVYATVGPSAVIAGAVSIGARAWIGVGAVVRDHVTIGEGAVVGAGALVVKPVAAHTLVTGSPAAVVREGVDGL